MTSTDVLTQELRKYSYSLTKARRAVFLCLEQASSPITMSELVNRLRSITDRASVYRTVALFEKIGIVQRVHIGWKYKLELSNAFQEHHHHMVCIQCGRISSFTEPATLEQAMLQLAAQQHFTILSHQVELQGLCQACQFTHKS